jgi:hypothetical protein
VRGAAAKYHARACVISRLARLVGETGLRAAASGSLMRFCTAFVLTVAVGWAQTPAPGLSLKIPPVKTTLSLEGQPVNVTAWGTVSEMSAGVLGLAVTTDLSGLQDNITPVLAAQLNRSEKCGERLSLSEATLVPAPPSSQLTVHLRFERWGCVKALGKEVVKRLVAGNGVVTVNLTPSVKAGGISLAAVVEKIDSDGTLGELLRSGSTGDAIRAKIASSIQAAIEKSTNLSALPPEIATTATIQTVKFSEGSAGHLWAEVAGEVHLSSEQLGAISRLSAR